jgi:hypothetical protein
MGRKLTLQFSFKSRQEFLKLCVFECGHDILRRYCLFVAQAGVFVCAVGRVD